MPSAELPPGALRRRVEAVWSTALGQGALRPIPTRTQVVDDHGISFLVRVAQRPRDKPAASEVEAVEPAGEPSRPANPFLPYEAALYVADVGDAHVALLNKYSVADHHLLIVTRRYEPQQSPLTVADFAALAQCLAEYDGLGFYNAGPVAGGSQPHKHLQLVPLPLDPRVRLPIEPLLEFDGPPERWARCPRLPFPHALIHFDGGLPPDVAPQRLERAYVELLRAVDRAPRQGPLRAYNLLATRRWMLLVPRTREAFHGISLNAVAFAGALLAWNDEQLAALRRAGPAAALAHVSS